MSNLSRALDALVAAPRGAQITNERWFTGEEIAAHPDPFGAVTVEPGKDYYGRIVVRKLGAYDYRLICELEKVRDRATSVETRMRYRIEYQVTRAGVMKMG